MKHEKWVEKNLNLGRGKSTPMTWDESAREQGQTAGKEVHLNQARGALK